MKILINEQGFAQVKLSDTTVTGEDANTSDSTLVNEGELIEGNDAAENMTTDGETPVEGEVPVEGETPAEGDSVEGETPVEGETAVDGEIPAEGEVLTDGINIDEGMIAEDGMFMEGMFPGDMGMGETTQTKGSVMSNWLFVLGISGATLVLSVVIGILLAKKRIKKGFDLYED